jgi:hypothetical protein
MILIVAHRRQNPLDSRCTLMSSTGILHNKGRGPYNNWSKDILEKLIVV